MIDAVKKFIKNYADFKGKTNRPDYWWVVLAIVICEVVLTILSLVFSALNVGIIGTILEGLFALAILVPSLAITVRRLRDVGKEWYCIFLALIPIVGEIILIIFLVKPSK